MTHFASVIRPDHGYDDAILISPLAAIRCENLNAISILEHVGNKLDLLSIQRDDANLRFFDTTADECLGDLCALVSGPDNIC